MGILYGYVAVFTAVGVFFVVAALVTAWALRPHHPEEHRLRMWIIPGGRSCQFNIRFYIVASRSSLDVDRLFYPGPRRRGLHARIEMLIFPGFYWAGPRAVAAAVAVGTGRPPAAQVIEAAKRPRQPDRHQVMRS
jgi:hypothetical protein